MRNKICFFSFFFQGKKEEKPEDPPMQTSDVQTLEDSFPGMCTTNSFADSDLPSHMHYTDLKQLAHYVKDQQYLSLETIPEMSREEYSLESSRNQESLQCSLKVAHSCSVEAHPSPIKEVSSAEDFSEKILEWPDNPHHANQTQEFNNPDGPNPEKFHAVKVFNAWVDLSEVNNFDGHTFNLHRRGSLDIEASLSCTSITSSLELTVQDVKKKSDEECAHPGKSSDQLNDESLCRALAHHSSCVPVASHTSLEQYATVSPLSFQQTEHVTRSTSVPCFSSLGDRKSIDSGRVLGEEVDYIECVETFKLGTAKSVSWANLALESKTEISTESLLSMSDGHCLAEMFRQKNKTARLSDSSDSSTLPESWDQKSRNRSIVLRPQKTYLTDRQRNQAYLKHLTQRLQTKTKETYSRVEKTLDSNRKSTATKRILHKSYDFIGDVLELEDHQLTLRKKMLQKRLYEEDSQRPTTYIAHSLPVSPARKRWSGPACARPTVFDNSQTPNSVLD